METHVTSDSSAERLLRCFDPDVTLVSGEAEHLVLSPRYGRLRRRPPLLAAVPHPDGTDAAWLLARERLLTCRDHSVQRALATYQVRVRIVIPVAVASLQDPNFDLARHGHDLLDQHASQRGAVHLRRESFWITVVAPDAEGFIRFECGNAFLAPIPLEAILAEAKTLW